MAGLIAEWGTLPLLWFAIIGAVAGFFAGLLGIGGGAIITPLLIVICADILPPAHITHIAIATSLAVIAATAMPSAFVHARNGTIIWKIGKQIAIGASIGALLSSFLVPNIPAIILNVVLVIFLLRVSYKMLRPAPPITTRLSRISPPLAGIGIGAFSALLGIGGGMLTVPYLTACGENIRRAIGTSAFVGAPLAMFAVIGYIAAPTTFSLAGLWGYVFLPAAFSIAIFSMIFAAIGARLTSKLPAKLLRNLFATLTLLSALGLLEKIVN